MRRPQRTAPQRKRRARSTRRTLRPAIGRSERRREYRLWTRPDIAPHAGHRLVAAEGRMGDERAIHVVDRIIRDKAPWDQRRGANRLHGIDSFLKPRPAGAATSSKLSQSQFWTPIDSLKRGEQLAGALDVARS